MVRHSSILPVFYNVNYISYISRALPCTVFSFSHWFMNNAVDVSLARVEKKAHEHHFIWKMLNALCSVLRALGGASSVSFALEAKNTRFLVFMDYDNIWKYDLSSAFVFCWTFCDVFCGSSFCNLHWWFCQWYVFKYFLHFVFLK